MSPTPRKITTPVFPSTDLKVDDTTTDGIEVDCMAYSKFLLSYRLTKTGVLVNGDRVNIQVQFREDGGTWHDYSNGPFNILYEEESTIPCNISVSGDCVGEKIRITATTDYTNATPADNYFTLVADVTLMV